MRQKEQARGERMELEAALKSMTASMQQRLTKLAAQAGPAQSKNCMVSSKKCKNILSELHSIARAMIADYSCPTIHNITGWQALLQRVGSSSVVVNQDKRYYRDADPATNHLFGWCAYSIIDKWHLMLD